MCACVCKCTGICECVCWMNLQNIFWRLESIHQRTLICILYKFFTSLPLFHLFCIFLGRHSLMARPQDTVSVFGRKGICPCFWSLSILFLQRRHQGSLGGTRGSLGETGGDRGRLGKTGGDWRRPGETGVLGCH